MSRQEFIDKYLGRAISKTFTVFIIGTLFFGANKLTGAQWIVIATVYLGSTKATETILKLKDKF